MNPSPTLPAATAPASAGASASPTRARLQALLGRAAPLARWRTVQRQFDQRIPRERLLLIAAAVALVLMLADHLWLGPALKSFRAARSQQLLAQTALQGLEGEVARLANQGSQQAQAQQAELVGWRQRVRDGEAALRQHEDSLVGPDRMIGLLEHLLARHGEVRVRAMRSLGRSDLLSPAGQAGQADSGAAAQPAAATATATVMAPGTASNAGAAASGGQASLYRHGVELVLEGGYVDLLSYLQAMEALPQRVLWGSVSLKVEQHPKSVLTLRVYTISRERHWLEI
jgi:MSHA biogenesis protein MshJ